MRRLRSTLVCVLAALVLAPILFGDGPPAPPAAPVGRVERDPSGVRISWGGLSGGPVTLHLSTNLSTWSPAFTVNTWPARSLTVIDYETNSPRRFYRIQN